MKHYIRNIQNTLKMNYLTLYSFILFALLISCQKEPYASLPKDAVISPTTGSRTEFTLDSIYLYAKQLYLWQDVLPSYVEFNPRQRYSAIQPAINAFRKELLDLSQIKQYSDGTAIEQMVQPGQAKYSYLEPGLTGTGNTATLNNVPSTGLYHKSWTQDGQNLSYLVIPSFAALTRSQEILDKTFSAIATHAPAYLIIDLRGNGGGYVETATYIANLIAPSKLQGKIMFSEQFHPQVQASKASILQYQPYLDANGKSKTYKGRPATLADVDFTEENNTKYFTKKGRLESVQQLYFIVNEGTASASELLISCMRPYFPLKLIGTRTYGKPVGFFPIHIDNYSLYLASFLIRNADGWSDYFQGMPADILVESAANYPIADPQEPHLAAVLDLIFTQHKAVSATSKRKSMGPKAGTSLVSDTKPHFVPLMPHNLQLKAY